LSLRIEIRQAREPITEGCNSECNGRMQMSSELPIKARINSMLASIQGTTELSVLDWDEVFLTLS
jgi:hypothetical protein